MLVLLGLVFVFFFVYSEIHAGRRLGSRRDASFFPAISSVATNLIPLEMGCRAGTWFN